MSANNSTNGTRINYFDSTDFRITLDFLYSLMTVSGTLFNAWMLAAILTSPEMRSSMRNKLTCVLLFNHLIKASVIGVMEFIEFGLSRDQGIRIDCAYGTFVRVMRVSVMWVENWYILIFFLHYAFTLIEFNPVKIFSQKTQHIGTILILVGPWVLSFIVGPSVLAHHFHSKFGARSSGCVYWTFSSWKTLADFSIVAPFFLTSGLLLVVLILHYIRKPRYSTMDASLIGPNTQIDDVRAYIVLFALFTITHLILVSILIFKIRLQNILDRIILYISSWLLSEAGCVIHLPAFFFFEDIRYRIKTWRPWYRPGPGIDLTVGYDQSGDPSTENKTN